LLLVGNVAALTAALRASAPLSQATGPVVTQQKQPVALPPPAAETPVTFAAAWEAPLPPVNQPLLPSADAGYVPLRNAVLRWGVSALPATPVQSTASTEKLDVEDLLGRPEPQPDMPPASLWEPLHNLFLGNHL
jgi:hypothetical protein